MRALVQRVSQAAVDVEGERVAQIGPGMLVLLGVGAGDGTGECDKLADKVAKLRIFDDDQGRMNEPLGEREVLCVSQFTLYGDTRRGNRPSYNTHNLTSDAQGTVSPCPGPAGSSPAATSASPITSRSGC
ncbi:MAG: D-aminoacyl-tRNA deacylase [Solirubrobacterales bacterium]